MTNQNYNDKTYTRLGVIKPDYAGSEVKKVFTSEYPGVDGAEVMFNRMDANQNGLRAAYIHSRNSDNIPSTEGFEKTPFNGNPEDLGKTVDRIISGNNSPGTLRIIKRSENVFEIYARN